MFRTISRLYHTVKFLKLTQIVWRGIYLLPRFIKPVNTHPTVLPIHPKIEFISKKNKTDDFRNFIFLNESYNLDEVGWNNKKIPKLWCYNLHYFEFLSQDNIIEKSQDALFILEKWIEENEFGKGTGFEPYPTSLRIINCIKWYFKTGNLSEKVVLSLWNQTRWLFDRPEYHLLGNHLFINAKALIFACALFQLDEKSPIYNVAITILQKELNEQFLPDGAHFELSPMYHSLAMEDLLDLISISSMLPLSFPKDKLEKKLYKGMEWLKTMIYNNDELSHFNDCANGIAPQYTELKEFASRLGLDFTINKERKIYYHSKSGFLVFNDLNTHLIADVGQIGPEYLPGHAHADTLSFELSLYGQRIIVNSGTSVYGTSPERHRQRGTSAHSTVEVDYQNSSEVWSGFRVARRAIPFNINVNTFDASINTISFNASHDGYKRLNNNPIHTRSWTLNRNYWVIEDRVSGKNNVVISRYYLHPEIEIGKYKNGYLILKNSVKLAIIEIIDATEIKLTDSTYHDEFGISKLNKCLQVKAISPCMFKIKIKLL